MQRSHTGTSSTLQSNCIQIFFPLRYLKVCSANMLSETVNERYTAHVELRPRKPRLGTISHYSAEPTKLSSKPEMRLVLRHMSTRNATLTNSDQHRSKTHLLSASTNGPTDVYKYSSGYSTGHGC